MKKRRNESFFGLSFDIFPNPTMDDCNRLEKFLSETKPDYIQCRIDCNYIQSSQFLSNTLNRLHEITDRLDISLYTEYDGLNNKGAFSAHPDWRMKNNDGNSNGCISYFSPLAESYIPLQIKVLIRGRSCEGVVITGDCETVRPDYSEWAKKEYKNRFSRELPSPDDADYYPFVKFCREGFRAYLHKYVNAIRKANPLFEIASENIYSSFSPEPPEIAFDFLTSSVDSLAAARMEARCLCNQGKSHDITNAKKPTWNVPDEKTLKKSLFDIASVIMHGGAYRLSVSDYDIKNLPYVSTVSEFIRKREALCHNTEPIHEIGIIYSRRQHYHDLMDNLFVNGGTHYRETSSLLSCVLDSGIPAEIILTHNAVENLSDYKVIILPDLSIIEPDLKRALLKYAESGGTLIIAGVNSTQMFLPYLDIDIVGGDSGNSGIVFGSNEKSIPFSTPYHIIKPNNNCKISSYVRKAGNPDEKIAVVSQTNYGNGKIVGIYINFENYSVSQSVECVDFIKNTLLNLYRPSFRFSSDMPVEAAVMKKNGQTRINLLNLFAKNGNGNKASVVIEADINTEPKNISVFPEGRIKEQSFENGILTIKLEELEIHSVICIED